MNGGAEESITGGGGGMFAPEPPTGFTVPGLPKSKSSEPPDPPADACALARSAAAAFGADLVGVDLLPNRDGSYSVIELNGAVEFTDLYGDDVFGRVAELLAPPSVVPLVPEPAVGLPLLAAPVASALDATV